MPEDDHEVVVSLALTGRGDLNLILGLKNPSIGAARATAVGKKDRHSVSTASAIAGDAWRSAQQFVWVGANRGQSLNILTIDRRPDTRVCRLQ